MKSLRKSIVLIGLLTWIGQALFAQGLAEITPSSHDFGDVRIGEIETTNLTITNVGDDVLTIFQLGFNSSNDIREVSNSFYPPIELLPVAWGVPDEASISIEVSFAPTYVGAQTNSFVVGSDSGGLSYTSIEIPFSGNGIEEEPPLWPTIEDLLEKFEYLVAEGSIEGVGLRPRVKQANLNRFHRLLKSARRSYESGFLRFACLQLQRAVNRSDGLPRPYDWITGHGTNGLNALTLETIYGLGCMDTHTLSKAVHEAGAAKLSDENVISVSPNPVRATILLKYQVPRAGRLVIDLLDVQGQWITELVNEENDVGLYYLERDLSHLPAGAYFLVYRMGVEIHSLQFLKH